jgi:hypothetical protein
MVVSDDLILLQVPAFNCFIFTATEQVGMLGADYEPSDSRNVACVGNFETASRKVPELDGSI